MKMHPRRQRKWSRLQHYIYFKNACFYVLSIGQHNIHQKFCRNKKKFLTAYFIRYGHIKATQDFKTFSIPLYECTLIITIDEPMRLFRYIILFVSHSYLRFSKNIWKHIRGWTSENTLIQVYVQLASLKEIYLYFFHLIKSGSKMELEYLSFSFQ